MIQCSTHVLPGRKCVDSVRLVSEAASRVRICLQEVGAEPGGAVSSLRFEVGWLLETKIYQFGFFFLLVLVFDEDWVLLGGRAHIALVFVWVVCVMFDFICEQFVLFFELLERVDVDFLANHFLGVGFDVLDEICEILADVEQHFLIWLLATDS